MANNVRRVFETEEHSVADRMDLASKVSGARARSASQTSVVKRLNSFGGPWMSMNSWEGISTLVNHVDHAGFGQYVDDEEDGEIVDRRREATGSVDLVLDSKELVTDIGREDDCTTYMSLRDGNINVSRHNVSLTIQQNTDRRGILYKRPENIRSVGPRPNGRKVFGERRDTSCMVDRVHDMGEYTRNIDMGRKMA